MNILRKKKTQNTQILTLENVVREKLLEVRPEDGRSSPKLDVGSAWVETQRGKRG